MKLLDAVTGVLEGHRVPFALIGAAALAARGIARSTFDIDLLTTDARVLHPDFWVGLRETGAHADIRRGDSDDPLGGVVRIEAPGERPVDVILGKQPWQARIVSDADRPAGTLPVVTARDLILLKLYAGGAQDLWDVRELLQLSGADELQSEVEAGLEGCSEGMRDAWAAVRPE